MTRKRANESESCIVDALLEGLKFCFCLACKHDPKYGLCDKCRCGNRRNVERLQDMSEYVPKGKG